MNPIQGQQIPQYSKKMDESNEDLDTSFDLKAYLEEFSVSKTVRKVKSCINESKPDGIKKEKDLNWEVRFSKQVKKFVHLDLNDEENIVQVKKKSSEGKKANPEERAQKILVDLKEILQMEGPTMGENRWSNFGLLENENPPAYHCHLYGTNPCFVAKWRV